MESRFVDINVDDMDFEDDDCEIEINNDTFVDVKEIEYIKDIEESMFENWWPDVARKVLHAIYSSEDNQKNSIRSLMSMFDYEHKEVEPLKLATEKMYKLYRLYRTKLEMKESYLTELKNKWCDLIKMCIQKCKSILQERNNIASLLAGKAKELLHKLPKNEQTVHVIKQEYAKSILEINKDFQMKMTLAKITFKEPTLDRLDMTIINENILKAKKDVNIKHDVEKVVTSYHAECYNLEYKLSKQIQEECEQYWMDALTKQTPVNH